jgi:hypothetical protein
LGYGFRFIPIGSCGTLLSSALNDFSVKVKSQ